MLVFGNDNIIQTTWSSNTYFHKAKPAITCGLDVDSTDMIMSTKVRSYIAFFSRSWHLCSRQKSSFQSLIWDLLWTVMDVDVDRPVGGQRIHMLWILLFLKDYSNGETLAGMSSVSKKTFRYWVDEFMDGESNLNLVRWIVDLFVLNNHSNQS